MISLENIPKVKEATGPKIRCPDDLTEYLNDAKGLAQEVFMVLTLNTKYKIIERHPVTVGLLDASLINPAVVFKRAIMDDAAAIILAHNHPSGDTTPSSEDLRITKQLIKAGDIMGIDVLDHVIVGDSLYSMKENGSIQFSV